jgi:hypothetical protein
MRNGLRVFALTLVLLGTSDALVSCTQQGSAIKTTQGAKSSQGTPGSTATPSSTATPTTNGTQPKRTLVDQPDTVTGFQIKAIYVVPSDGVDHAYDTNGYIAGVLDAANVYLKQQIGQTMQIDRTKTGVDVQFMRSKKNTAYFTKQKVGPSDLLIESKILDKPGTNRKDYIFYIDVPSFQVAPASSDDACGYGSRPGLASIVAVSGDKCTGEWNVFSNYGSKVTIHEIFHNFGVKHTFTNCDLMQAPITCPFRQSMRIDMNRNLYVTSARYGQDIVKLRVWKGYTARLDIRADCWLGTYVPRYDKVRYAYCPTGLQTIGALTHCWKNFTSVALQEKRNGKWVSLGSGSHYYQPWGPLLGWTCKSGSSAPWKKLTVLTPEIKHYRWVINGRVGEYLNVIWVR